MSNVKMSKRYECDFIRMLIPLFAVMFMLTGCGAGSAAEEGSEKGLDELGKINMK